MANVYFLFILYVAQVIAQMEFTDLPGLLRKSLGIDWEGTKLEWGHLGGSRWLWESPASKSHWAALLPCLKVTFPRLKILKIYLSQGSRFSSWSTSTTYCPQTYNYSQSPTDPGRISETWKTLLGMESNGFRQEKKKHNFGYRQICWYGCNYHRLMVP